MRARSAPTGWGVLGALLLTFGASACKSDRLDQSDVDRFEANVRLPAGAYRLESYARFYAQPRVHTLDELPFTTILDPAPGWPEPRSKPVVAAVFVQADGLFGEDWPTAHIVEESRLPSEVHGGCGVINLILDPATGETLESWCNARDPSVSKWPAWDEAAPPLTATARDCELLRVVVREEGLDLSSSDFMYIDPEGWVRPYSTDRHGRRSVITPDDLRSTVPGLDVEAATLFSAYFDVGPRYAPNCDWQDLPVETARSSFVDQPPDRSAHQYPRIGLTEPWFSADGQWAVVSYYWHAVPAYGFNDTCFYRRARGHWTAVQCVLHPRDGTG
ncbi:hypothetical protein [Brevundimonas sp.]|uniref:hypothetical protein n=1 Tax=Brevundimonas sp. TaxID=1871086 RepID=UPI001D85CAA8|nr:hypothetical protein [Brevundimonas sp.]MBL0946750.1 hypothetical protein [Brevundimonas sp.]